MLAASFVRAVFGMLFALRAFGCEQLLRAQAGFLVRLFNNEDMVSEYFTQHKYLLAPFLEVAFFVYVPITIA